MEAPNWFEVRSKTRAPERRAYHGSFVTENHLYVYGGEDSHEGIRHSMYYISLDFMGKTAGRLGCPDSDPKWVSVTIDPRYK